MKICVIGDVHFTQHSFVSLMGSKYPVRLENHIQSLNWAEQTAKERNCDIVVYLGDFFDRPNLDEIEITALKDVTWNGLPHYFLVGNHDSGVKSLEYNAVNILQTLPNNTISHIINHPSSSTVDINTNLLFLPYIMEDDRKPLTDYIKETEAECENLIVFSHNDLKNIQYGNMLSRKGFEVEEIDKHCKLFINGHIHNHFRVDDTIVNLGILTGQNFNEDGSKYDHKIMILNTEEPECLEFITNPYAFNFYKLEMNKDSDLNQLQTLKNNAVVSIKVQKELIDSVKKTLSLHKNIIASKLSVMVKNVEVEATKQINDVNHIKQFVEFILNTLGSTELVNEELNNIVGA